MSLEDRDFAQRYAQLGEIELFAIARDYDSLTEAAQAALRAEFASRKLEPPLVEEPEPELGSRKLVTVRRYRDNSEAIVARSLLESAGIVVYLFDETLVRLDWQLSNFIGGMRLQVEEADVAVATELLNQPPPDPLQFQSAEEFTQPHCPRCGSADVTMQAANLRPAAAFYLFLHMPWPVGQQMWECNSCGARSEYLDKAIGQPIG